MAAAVQDGKTVKYDLIAVANHMGGYGGGHYTAYCREQGTWIHFDDSRVVPISAASVVVGVPFVMLLLCLMLRSC